MKKKKGLWVFICAILLVLSIGWIAVMEKKEPKKETLPREEDKEFLLGSGIETSHVTEMQEEGLYKLCKVWGYAKYRHPLILNGTLNWDAELFRVIPKVLEAGSGEEVNDVLYTWLAQFPYEVQEPDEMAEAWLELHNSIGYETADMAWIEDEDFLGEELGDYLKGLSEVYITDRENSYAGFAEGGYVEFRNEKAMSVMGDDGARLLGLFRFWNMYEYYSPNVRITRTDWNQVLRDAIPEILDGEGYEDYVLTMGKVTAATGDAHLYLSDNGGVIWYYYGRYSLPCRFKMIDGQIVVSKCKTENGGLKPGDILLKIEDTAIEERLEFLKEHMAVPTDDKVEQMLHPALLRTQKEKAEVAVIRDGEEKTLMVHAYKETYHPPKTLENGLLEGENIGYIDPSALNEGDVEKLMEKFADTDGLIVDLREYPSVSIMYLLGEYIIPEPTQFARISLANQAIPGCFVYMDHVQSGAGVMASMGDETEYPFYDKKVVLLMDETSVSQSEFTIMALRQAPNAVVVGNPSIGADGNIVGLSLPGNLSMSISGLGIYTPEGEQTQRVGLMPDVECYPTLEGIRAGRDELVEKGVQIIRESVKTE